MSTHDDNLLAGRFAALAPEPLPADWNDVLNRRGAARRRRSWWFPRWRIVAAAAATLIGGVLVTPAFGVGERLLDLLRDEQRPPEVLSPAWSPDGQKIAFVSNVGGAYEISVMNADGSGLQKLPGTASGAFVWSPDGRMLLFTSESRAGGSPVSAGLYVINVDGTGRRLITRQADLNRPAWSPDGRQIAFMGHEPFTIHVVNKDGSGHRMLADNAFGPVWSPDGEQIAFSGRNDVGASDIFVMNANGTERQNLTRDSAQDNSPAWSPDGRKIAFLTTRNGSAEIHVVNADRSEQRMLTHGVVSIGPVWSPDGQQIAFVGDRLGNQDIYVVNADGSGERRLTDDPASDWLPAWSDDGRRIVFASDRGGPFDVWVMSADGGEQRKLTRVSGGG